MITATIKLTIKVVNMTEQEARKLLTELMESRELECSFEDNHTQDSEIVYYEVTDDTAPTILVGKVSSPDRFIEGQWPDTP